MSSDSSTSEEEIDRVREAVDVDFLTDNLYKSNSLGGSHECPKSKQLPSLRNQAKKTDSFNPFSIKVTPHFQKHVAQHLSNLLDTSIDHSKKFLQTKRRKKNLCSGVKLLSSSQGFVVSDYNESNKMEKNSGKVEESDDSDREKKAKEVAVTGEWILSQQETKNWSQNMKGEVEVIKLNWNKKEICKKNRKKKSEHSLVT